MKKNKLIKVFIVVESIILFAFFLDTVYFKDSFLYQWLGKNLYEVLGTNSFFATFILFFYGFWGIIKYGQWKEPINYLAICSSWLYLYLMYVEVVVEKAF